MSRQVYGLDRTTCSLMAKSTAVLSGVKLGVKA